MTKKYKVGDIIYAKGKIIQANESHGKFPYCVSFSDSDFTGIIDMCHAWLDEDTFVESPAKPTIPKDVADEMEVFRKSNKLGAYLYLALNQTETVAYRWTNNDRNIASLVNAWNNGYTVEKEPVSLVYVPGTKKCFVYCKRGKWSKQGANSETPVTPQAIATWRALKDKDKSLFEFTNAEITKFGLQDCEKEEVTDNEQ